MGHNKPLPELWPACFSRALASLGVECADCLSTLILATVENKGPGCGRWHNSWEQQLTAGGGRYKGRQQQAAAGGGKHNSQRQHRLPSGQNPQCPRVSPQPLGWAQKLQLLSSLSQQWSSVRGTVEVPSESRRPRPINLAFTGAVATIKVLDQELEGLHH